MKIFNTFFAAFSAIRKYSVIKTLRANFGLLPFNQAKNLPILIFRGTDLKIGKDAKVTFECQPKFGIFRFGGLNFKDIPNGSKNIFKIKGELILKGSAIFAYNTRLIISKSATLQMGGVIL